MLGYRIVWLARDRDQYTTARLQDPAGNSGSFIGHQIEAQLQNAARYCRFSMYQDARLSLGITTSG